MESKICSFCVNNYHLVVILMPYIYEKTNENKKIITFFENDLRDIYKKVLETNELFWKNKDKFKETDWNSITKQNISLKCKEIKDGSIVIISGSNEFIDKINSLVLNFHTNFTIVNCFEVNSLNGNMNFDIEKYDKILNTKGLEDIKKINLV